jgi:hypothetical protein
MPLSDKQRILRILNFNYNRGLNKESVNKVLYKILKIQYGKEN